MLQNRFIFYTISAVVFRAKFRGFNSGKTEHKRRNQLLADMWNKDRPFLQVRKICRTISTRTPDNLWFGIKWIWRLALCFNALKKKSGHFLRKLEVCVQEMYTLRSWFWTSVQCNKRLWRICIYVRVKKCPTFTERSGRRRWNTELCKCKL